MAAAVGDNSTGVTGIAYKCKILPVKIFLGDELVSFNIIANAIRYAGQRADALSNSWGIPPSVPEGVKSGLEFQALHH